MLSDKAERYAQMLEMRQAGETYQSIGKRFNVSRQRVQQLLMSAGTKGTQKCKSAPVGVYNVMTHYYAENGYVPSLRDILQRTDYHSTSSVRYAMQLLEMWGWIKRERKTVRGYVLTRPTERGLTPEQLRALIAETPVYTHWKA